MRLALRKGGLLSALSALALFCLSSVARAEEQEPLASEYGTVIGIGKLINYQHFH